MRLLLPLEIAERIRESLRQGGRNEVGGILMGEHVEADVFRVVDLTVQRSHGTIACFVRDPAEHRAQLDEFFRKHDREYSRFNYLGEWHSHPLFSPQPSETDLRTMQEIVSDTSVGVNFAVLIIARSGRRNSLQLSAAAFVADKEPLAVDLVVESDPNVGQRGAPRWIARFIKWFS